GKGRGRKGGFFSVFFFWAFCLSYSNMKERIDARSPDAILCSPPSGLPALLYPTQLPLLLGFGLRLDPVFRPPLPYARHSGRATLPIQTLLLLPPLLQQSPLESR